MKICMIGAEITPTRGVFVGSPSVNIMRLSTELSKKNHQIHIVSTLSRSRSFTDSHIVTLNTTEDSEPGGNLDLGWGTIHPLHIKGDYLSLRYGLKFAIKSFGEVKRLSKKGGIQLIHGHSGYPISGLITGIIGKFLKLPSVHTLYCPVQKPVHDHKHKIFSSTILTKRYFSNIDTIIAISTNVKNSLEKIGISTEKIRIIPPAIDTEKFNPSISGKKIRDHLGLNQNDFVLLFIGNLSITKGIDILLDAMKIINRTSNLKLIMTLDYPLPGHEKRKSEIMGKIESFGIKSNIIQIGLVENIAVVMAACNVLVVPFLATVGPSDYPMPILEAMAVGKPVIATRVGGISEIVKPYENGLLIEPNNVDELVAAILYMLSNKEEAKNMGKKTAKIISEIFRSEIVADELEKIYGEVISNYSGNRRC